MPTQAHRHRALDAAEILRLQVEANEQLLLAALQASEHMDDAQVAQQRAELEVSVLRAGEEELRTTAAFRERLIGIIGHDLRTPLNTVLMASGLLIAKSNLSETDSALVLRILSSGQRMARMISQLADFTRARLGGGFALVVAPTDMGEVCQEIAEELRVTAPVQLQLLTRGELCGAWDADRLTQALSNIASNAVDHADPGTSVLIEAYGDGAWVEVRVTNEGECIPPEMLPVIFTAFRRAEADTSRRTGHLGLGLFVACEITRAHGGSIDVRSSNRMTTFVVRLPRSAAH